MTEERHYLGMMIIIYSPGINQIPTARRVYYSCLGLSSLFFCCRCLPFKASSLDLHLRLSLFMYYCIIDVVTLRVALEGTRKGDNDFSPVVVFVCLVSAAKPNTFEAFARLLNDTRLLTIHLFLSPCPGFSRYLERSACGAVMSEHAKRGL